ncbi:MAG: sodium/solute symporter [Oscillospiraceae bacterium]
MTDKIKIAGYVVLGIYMIGMLGIGFYCHKKNSGSLSNYLLGGRNLGPWVFALTYGTTYLSSSTFIGNAGTAYKGGLAFLFMPVAQMILLPLGLIWFSNGLRKVSSRLDAATIPEFLSKRYKSPVIGLLASIVIILFFVPYMVGIVKGGAVSLQSLLGVSYNIGVVLVSVVAAVYLIFGGYMARAYTDVVQGIMMFIGMALVVVAGFFIIGGPSEIASAVQAVDPALVETPGPMGWSSLFLFSTVFAIAPWGLPSLVQTNFTIKDKKTIHASAIVLSIWIGCILLGSMIIGNMGRAYFGDAYLSNVDSVFPALVLEFFPNFLGAVIIAAVIAAAMSTIDGVLMTNGSAVGVDIFKRYIKKDATDKQVMLVTNIAMLAIVAIVIVWAFNPPQMILTFSSFAFSVIAAGLIVPVFGGTLTKKGTSSGAVASLVTGVVTTLFWYVVKVNGNFILGIPPFVVGMLLSAVAFFLVSKFTRQLPSAFVDDLLLKDEHLEITKH